MRKITGNIIRVLLHIGALLPLAIMVWDFFQRRLTANPIDEIQLRTGIYTLLLLTLSLACTPLYRLTGLKEVMSLRRPLGLYAFGYASLHLLNFIGLDYGFNFSLLWPDINDKRYIIVGFVAFLILLALAVTSTSGWIRRLGKNWQRLHRFVYLAAALSVLHYFWQLKVYVDAPLIYAIILVVLLLLRIPLVSKRLTRHPV
jgi:sulfoxide reductase heme-binding subunit YedZ